MAVCNFGPPEDPAVYQPSPHALLSPAARRETSYHHVVRLLYALKARKAAGPDGFSPALLKAAPETIAGPLAALLRTILRQQVVPAAWKQAITAPIPKVKPPSSTDQMRGISLLDTSSKVFERVLRTLLEEHIQPHRNQFGFSSRCGLSDAWLFLQRTVAKATPPGRSSQITIVSLDVAKAFDRLPHSVILASLRECGVEPFLVNTVASWLQGRQHRVRVGQALSSPYAATSGVPQGALSSPCLWLGVMNRVLSIPLHDGSTLLAFADDALLVRYTGSSEDQALLQTDLSAVIHCINSLGLSLNAAKSKVLTIGFDPAHQSLTAPLTIAGLPIPEVQELKWLGISVDNRMSASRYWTKMAATVKRGVGDMHRLLHGHAPSLAYALNTWCFSLFTHALVPMPPPTESTWRKLTSAYTYAARLLLNDFQTSSASEVRRRAGLPSAEERWYQLSFKFMYQCNFLRRRFVLWLREDEAEDASRRRSERTQKNPYALRRSAYGYINKDAFQRGGLFLLLRAWADADLLSVIATRRNADPPLLHPCSSLYTFTKALPEILATTTLPSPLGGAARS